MKNLSLTTKMARNNQGQALLIAVFFFVVVSALVVSAISVPLLRGVNRAGAHSMSVKSFYVGESGAEDVVYRLKVGKDVSSTETVPIGVETVSVVNNDIGAGNREVIAEGSIDNRIRKVRYVLRTGEGATFNFGVQSDTGGILMENSSSVNGNAFSNGSIEGSGTNLVDGDAISAGPAGLIDGIHASGSAYAHTISDSTVDTDAYYFATSTLINTTVGGVKYPNSPDQDTTTLPITDTQIATWESDAEAGGVIECPPSGPPYVINSNTTLGPVKINCDLQMKNNPTITLGGSVWVAGNVSIENNVSYVIDPSLAGQSVPFIADNPVNRETSSQISFKNSGFFDGAGQGSYVVMISQNESAENNGPNYAIRLQNGASGDLLVYAGHGEILLENNVDLKEVTAYKVHLKNSAEVTYETGLANLLFTTGPGGGFNIDSWEEVE